MLGNRCTWLLGECRLRVQSYCLRFTNKNINRSTAVPVKLLSNSDCQNIDIWKRSCDNNRKKLINTIPSFLLYHRRLLHHSDVSMAIRLFEDKEHASLYSQFRPTYPEGVYSTIVDYYRAGKGETCNFDLAVDVGCGNGQSSRPLCKYFKNVIGCDVSEEQVASAAKDDANLTFHVGQGEDLSFLQDSSVDVVTIAQALHWLDQKVFYPEVERVLKPGGVFVAYGYGQNVLDDPEAERCMTEFYSGLLGPYWDIGRHHIETHYRDFKHPFTDSKRIENDDITITRTWPIDAYVGYLSTWSSWRKYLKKHPDSTALTDLADEFRRIYRKGKGGDNLSMSIVWGGFMLIGRKPK